MSIPFVHKINYKEVTDENGFTIKYVIVYTHSSLGSEPVEILLDCASRTECTHILKVNNSHGEYSIATGAVTPVGKARENIKHYHARKLVSYIIVTCHNHNCLYRNKHFCASYCGCTSEIHNHKLFLP